MSSPIVDQDYTFFESIWQKHLAEGTALTAYGTFPFVLHVIVFWTVNLPFILLQFGLLPQRVINWTEQYRVNEKKQFTNEEWFKVFWGVLKLQFFVILPTSLINVATTEKHLPRDTELLPAWYQVVFQLLCFMIIEDTLFFAGHRLFHTQFLYKWFHSVHHRVRYTTSIAAEFFHPVEYFVAVVAPVIAGPFLMRSHLLTYVIWQSIMQIESIFAHCGYNFPFIPIVDGREHAFHHSHIESNYGSWFLIWDKLFGTDAAYKLYLKKKELKKQKQQEGKKSSVEGEHSTIATSSGVATMSAE